MDDVRLRSPLHEDDPWDQQRFDLMKATGLNTNKAFTLMAGKNDKLLPAWRIMAMESTDLEEMEHPEQLESWKDMVNVDNELRMYRMLRDVIDQQLSEYPTTREHDLELWERRDQLAWRHRLALTMRLSEKNLLHVVREQLMNARKNLRDAVRKHVRTQ